MTLRQVNTIGPRGRKWMTKKVRRTFGPEGKRRHALICKVMLSRNLVRKFGLTDRVAYLKLTMNDIGLFARTPDGEVCLHRVPEPK
jgi:hypothetical protein